MKLYFRFRNAFDLTVAAIVAGLVTMFGMEQTLVILDEVDGRLFLATATISATLLGFSLASASFLIAQANSERMALLKNSKSYYQLVGLVQSALWRFFALTLVSLFTYQAYEHMPMIAISLYAAFSSIAILAAVPLIWVVSAILRLT